MMHFNKEDIEWGKVFKITYIIIAIMIIVIIWKPETSLKIAKYNKLDSEEVNELASREYINRFLRYVHQNDIEKLYNKLDDSYISYNIIDRQKFENLYNNMFNYNQIDLYNINIIKYGDTNIYRATLNSEENNRKINVIEKSSNEWTYTIDDFYNYKITNFSNKYNDIKFTIDSVYQTFEQIEFTCYIENATSNMMDIHLEQEESVILELSNNDVVYLSNAQIDEKISKIESKSFSSRTLKFNIDLANQANIEQIIFTNIEINGEKGNLTINLYI